MGRTIVFTGGGTGGHVFPGLAVMDELKKRWDGEIVWIGSARGMERDIVSRRDIRYLAIPAGKLRREFTLRNLVDVFRVAGGIFRSYVLLRNLRPAALFSKGGYVSVPPVIAARMLRIPVLTHESDMDPGLATRINARFAERIFVPYEETVSHFAGSIRDRVQVSGNPVRSEIFSGNGAEGRRIIGAPAGKRVLFVVGGSQGAAQINQLIARALPRLTDVFFVVHQTGAAVEESAPQRSSSYYPVRFIREEYGHILKAADLVVSRAGAGTLWEIAVSGKASVLIPLSGSGTRGDQVRNAQLFADRGAAVVMEEPATADRLADIVLRLGADDDQRSAMGAAAQAIGRGDAAEQIAHAVYLAAIRTERGREGRE